MGKKYVHRLDFMVQYLLQFVEDMHQDNLKLNYRVVIIQEELMQLLLKEDLIPL